MFQLSMKLIKNTEDVETEQKVEKQTAKTEQDNKSDVEEI